MSEARCHRRAATLHIHSGRVNFEKWQALGNDYLIVERSELRFELTPARIRAICAPHTGVGADGILLLSEPSDGEFVARLQIFNPDGSEAELSGTARVRRSCTCAGAAGPTLISSRSRPPPDRSGRRSPRLPRAPSRWARGTACGVPTFPSGDENGVATLTAAGPPVAFPVRPRGQPPVRDRDRERGRARRTRPQHARPADRAPRAVPEPNERVVVHRARAGRNPRAYLRAWGGGNARPAGLGRPAPLSRYASISGVFIAGHGQPRWGRAHRRGRLRSCRSN